MSEYINPLTVLRQQKEVKAQQIAVASAAELQAQELATASALTNVDPSMCPKCGRKMGFGLLYDRTRVYYCDVDRVSQPME